MTPREVALRLAVVQVLGDLIKDARSSAAEESHDVMEAGDRITASLHGSKVASVSMTHGATRSKVTDLDKLSAWVAEHHPTEVEQVTQIRPGFLKALQDRAKKLGAAVDEATGEVIPGLEVTSGHPYPSVRLAPGARDIVADAWRAGALPLDVVIAIGEGSEDQ